jgi:hypothetical protein
MSLCVFLSCCVGVASFDCGVVVLCKVSHHCLVLSVIYERMLLWDVLMWLPWLRFISRSFYRVFVFNFFSWWNDMMFICCEKTWWTRYYFIVLDIVSFMNSRLYLCHMRVWKFITSQTSSPSFIYFSSLIWVCVLFVCILRCAKVCFLEYSMSQSLCLASPTHSSICGCCFPM